MANELSGRAKEQGKPKVRFIRKDKEIERVGPINEYDAVE